MVNIEQPTDQQGSTFTNRSVLAETNSPFS